MLCHGFVTLLGTHKLQIIPISPNHCYAIAFASCLHSWGNDREASVIVSSCLSIHSSHSLFQPLQEQLTAHSRQFAMNDRVASFQGSLIILNCRVVLSGRVAGNIIKSWFSCFRPSNAQDHVSHQQLAGGNSLLSQAQSHT